MSTKMRRVIAKSIGFGLLAALSLAMSITSFAQSDNTQISGFVKDQAGGVIAGAKVTVKSETRDFERVATTNGEGYYVVTQLPPGLYNVAVEASGFKLYKESARKLDPNLPAKLDVSLQPGQLTDVVTVTAATNSVQTETATVGKLVEGKQIELIQLNGRNPLLLAVLKPGVLGGSLQGNSFGLTTGGLNINGSRTQDNLITFDGAVGVRTRSNGTSIGVADLDATQEIQILTANYSAEYGRSAGGQIRIVTRSGQKGFHGGVYEYLRNAAFNSNTWARNRLLSAARPCDQFPKDDACRPSPFRYNQYGYNVSGPVLIPGTDFNKDRNKLFWLFSQEWVKQRATGSNVQRVPTARMRAGDFSEIFPGGPNFVSQLNVQRFLKDPLKSGGCSATDTSGCFSDGGVINKIPANRLSPNGLAILKAFPEPVSGFFDSGGSNFFQSRPVQTDQRKETVSIDYYPTEKHQIRGRMALYHFVDVSAFRGATDRAPQIIDRPNQTLSIGWTWSLSPNWISETLVAGSRDQVFIAVDTRGDRYKRSIYGINYPYIFKDPKEIQDKIPTVDGLDIFGSLDGGPYPSSSTGPIYQFNNNWTNIRGNHTIKFGGYFERAGQNDFDQINVSGTPGGTNNQNGRFVFANGTPGGTNVAVGNAAIGLFDTYAEIGNRSFTPYRGHMFEWFIQDSWKATPRLKLEYGVRHSIIQPYYSLWRNMAVFDQGSYDPNIAVRLDPLTGFIISSATDLKARYNGLVIPGDGWPDAAKGPGRIAIATTGEFDFLFRDKDKQYSDIHKSNFQPRVGLAFALNDKNVVRAGLGRYLTRLGVSDSVFLGGNPPFQPTVSISRGNVDNPGGTGGNVFPLVITTQDRIFPNPEAWTWNTTYEREIGFDTKVEISYVGRRSLHAQRERNINQLAVGTCPTGVGCPVIPGDPQGRRFNPDALRPFKGFGIIRVTNNDANATYNSFQVGVDRRFSKGLLFGFAYTLSKSSDDSSAQRDVIPNAFDAHNLWGPSDFDRRHAIVLNFAYELPFFKNGSGLMRKLAGGWVLSGTSQMATGNPITIRTGDDFAGVGPGSGSQFWIFTGAPTIDGKFAATNAEANYWFNPRNADGSAIFTRPAAGTISTQQARGLLYGPGFQNHNLRIQKDFRVSENHRVTFLAEGYNWLNHPNWNGPDTNPNNLSTTFGKITGKSSERQLQFALRYQF
ncbi:MAG TPA: carboxypeptidase regulatory-like domain-containing protein [Blastocatellia bacterium]|nr:carboxypeptidase regulatory-like domain-containing protein [Blastocatellia bacterium]